MKSPINHFDRKKPFYPLIMSYLIQIAGIKELIVHGSACAQEDHPLHLCATKERKMAMNSSKDMSSLLGPLVLRSEFQNSPIVVEIDELAGELMENGLYIFPSYVQASGALLVLAHEMTKSQQCRQDKSPLSEFLRHCRNAAVHDGLFNFGSTGPREPASWNEIVLGPDHNKTPIFNDQNGVGLLSPGDSIRLLYDVEQTYPDLHV